MNEHLRQRITEYLRHIRINEQERRLIVAITEVAYETGRRDGYKEANDVADQVSNGRSKDAVEPGYRDFDARR